MDRTWETPDFLHNELILTIIEQIEAVIENFLINGLELEQLRDVIYGEIDVQASGCHEIERRSAWGLIIIEVWFSLRRVIDNILENGEVPSLNNIYAVLLNVIVDGVNNAINRYRDALSVLVRGCLSDVLSRIYLALNNVDNVAGQEFRKAIMASLNILVDNNGADLPTRLRNAGSALLTGIIGIIRPDNDCPNLYQLFLQLIAMIQNSSTLLDSLIDALTRRDIEYFQAQRRVVEQYYSELMQIDIDRFRTETECYRSVSEQIASARNERELNDTVRQVLHGLGITMSWERTHDSFDAFMNDRNARMRFE